MLDKAPDLSRKLNISVWQVYQLTAEGKIPGIVRLGPRTIRYNPAITDPWIASGCPPVESDNEQPGAAAHVG